MEIERATFFQPHSPVKVSSVIYIVKCEINKKVPFLPYPERGITRELKLGLLYNIYLSIQKMKQKILLQSADCRSKVREL